LQTNKNIKYCVCRYTGGFTPKEKSSGAVIFRKENGKMFFLVLHYHFKGDYWDLVRGKMEGNENEKETAKREIKEETGIEVKNFIGDFRETSSWFYRWDDHDIYKEAVYFLAEAGRKEINLSDEHLEYEWLEYEDAIKKLTYENSRIVLQKAFEFLSSR